MFKIKNSFADCYSCPLLEAPSGILWTNTPDNLEEVDILIVAENPGKSEVEGCICEGVKYPAGTPLIGKSGTICRKMVNKYIEPNDVKHLMTNVVLCATIEDGKTINPTEETINKCKENLFKIIDFCKPKLILSLGSSPMKAFDISGTITKNQGNFFKFKEYEVLVAFHPSYVARNGGLDSDQGKLFEQCFQKALKKLGKEVMITESANVIEQEGKVHTFKIPEEYYSDEYRLIDVQFINYNQKLIFIFRNKDNKKIIYSPKPEHNNYYWYEGSSKNHVEKFENLKLIIGNYKEKHESDRCFESDVKIDSKHALDYYIHNKGEPELTKKNILFYDIECYTGDFKEFPEPQKGDYPINAISFAVDDEQPQVFLLNIQNSIDPNLENIKDKFENLRIFTNEKELIKTFIEEIHKKEPDYICGWNSWRFDDQYLYSRMKNLKMDPSSLSPFNNVYIDGLRGISQITGYVPLDLMVMYQNLTWIREPSYKLENICQKVLKRGKKEYSGNLAELYEKDIKLFIEYSFTDCNLLQDLNKSLQHVQLQDELRRAATTSHHSALSTIGQADGLFAFILKQQGFSMKNAGHVEKRELVGAYVRKPTGGIYDWVIDFDYTSLYPSILCSFNIGLRTYLAKLTKEQMYQYVYKKEEFKKLSHIEITLDPIYNNTQKSLSVKEFEDFLKKHNAVLCPSGCIFKGHEFEKTIFYDPIKRLFNQRKIYRAKATECEESGDKTNQKIFNNRQQAYKILMNSLYGVLAQEHFRFFNIDLAEAVTLSGQELIKYAGDHIDKLMESDENTVDINSNFITDIEEEKSFLKYCDTDSLFLHMKPYLEKIKKDITVENIIEEAKKLQNYLNDNLLKRYALLHNISQEESMLHLKNEFLAKRYYTLTQKAKKYAMYIIFEDGIEKDYIDVKGLETRRSDIPELTKVMLHKILDVIMKTEFPNVNQLYEYVDSIEEMAIDMAKKGDSKLFKSVVFSKPENEYKVIPQHIKGMKIWNILEYDHFRYGGRGTLYPLNGIDLQKLPPDVLKRYNEIFMTKFNKDDLNVIVVPEDIQIPNYYIIDVQRIIKTSVKDRAEILLEPLAVKSADVLKW